MSYATALLLGLTLAMAGPKPTLEATRAELFDALAGMTPSNLGVREVAVTASLLHAQDERLVPQWRQAPRAGQVWVAVDVVKGSEVVRRAQVRVELVPMRAVLVVTRTLASGSVIGARDVKTEVRMSDDGLDLAPAAVVGRSVTQDIEAGGVLRSGAVALPPPSPRGHKVRVNVIRGVVTITANGVLEHAARVGEPASVRLDATHNVIRGRMMDENTVQIGGEHG